MREIKFRAWSKKSQRMLYNVAIDTVGDVMCGLPGFEYIPLQFTGLKDCDGKEIYEGDIVAWTKGYCCYKKGNKDTVRWNEEECGFSPFCETNNIEQNEWMCGINEKRIRVVGNIYELK